MPIKLHSSSILPSPAVPRIGIKCNSSLQSSATLTKMFSKILKMIYNRGAFLNKLYINVLNNFQATWLYEINK